MYRRLQADDYAKGFLEALSFLTTVGQISEESFKAQFSEMFPTKKDVYKIVVIVDRASDQVIGCGSLIIEHKFIH